MGRRARRPVPLVACLAAAWLGGSARAEITAVTTEPESGVRIEIEGWAGLGTAATGREHGLIPIQVTVGNGSPAAHAWTIGPDERFGSSGRPLATATIRVPAGGTGGTTLYLEVASGNTAMLVVRGYGVVGGAGYLPIAASPSPPAPPDIAEWRRRNVGMSRQVLAARGAAAGGSVPLDMDRAPADWRGWSAFRKLLMTADEWRGLPAAARKAALDWTMLGGHVVVLAAEDDDALPDLPPAGGAAAAHGWPGRVVVARWDGRTLDDRAIDRLSVEPESFEVVLSDYVRPTPATSFPGAEPDLPDQFASGFSALAAEFGPRTLPVGAILTFLAVFGVVAGPFNVLVLAGAGRRERMFWTTPLISLAATTVLLTLMFLRDGVGGAGARRVVALLDPERATMAVIQEQFSRTGVLLGLSFPVNEPSWMIRLGDVDSDDALLESDGAVRSGGWFRSRSDQAYLIEAVRPSRARIEYVPPDAAGLPAVVSSVEVPLRRVFVIDDEGDYWQAADVGTGERTPLRAASAAEFTQWFGALTVDAGPARRRALEAVVERRGVAVAESVRPAKLAVTTLPSIRWNDDRAVLVCPIGAGGAR